MKIRWAMDINHVPRALQFKLACSEKLLAQKLHYYYTSNNGTGNINKSRKNK